MLSSIKLFLLEPDLPSRFIRKYFGKIEQLFYKSMHTLRISSKTETDNKRKSHISF